MGTGEMLGVTLRWTSIPSREGGGSRNTPSRFMLMKPEISAGLMGLLASKQRLYFYSWIIRIVNDFILRPFSSLDKATKMTPSSSPLKRVMFQAGRPPLLHFASFRMVQRPDPASLSLNNDNQGTQFAPTFELKVFKFTTALTWPSND